MRMVRTIHLQYTAGVGKLRELVPDVKVSVAGEDGEPTDDPDLQGLAMVDDDGEVHIYVLNDERREGLLRQLTSGIVLP